MNDTTATTATADQADERPQGRLLSPAEFAATFAKISKINERAEKRGFTGRFEVKGEQITETTKDELGFEITEVLYRTTITGESPKYNGWTFLARIDRTGDTFTVATAPGVEYVDRSLVRAGHCDHCSQQRARNNTYLVQHEDGTIKNVGSSCIKDFLGWQGSFAFISEEDVERDLFGSSRGGERDFTMETVLAVAYACVKVFGWAPASSYDKVPTRERVSTILTGRLPKDRQGRVDPEYAKAADYVDEAKARALVIRDFLASDDFAGRSTYVENLKALAEGGFVTWKQIGLVASAPNAYTRFLESADERAAKEAQWASEKAAKAAEKASSVYLGAEKDKVTFKGTLTSIRYIPGEFGTAILYSIRTESGSVVKWFASDEKLGDKEGVEVHLTATIKSLEEYQGVKQTVVTRASKINPDTGKAFSARASNAHWRDTEYQEGRGYVSTHEATPHKDCEHCYNAAHAADEN